MRESIRALCRLQKHITRRHPLFAKLLLEVDDAPEPDHGISEH